MPSSQSVQRVNPQCTYRQTLKNYQIQEWATCYDCFPSDTEGACLSCLLKCHRGHNLGPLRQSNFFCDCGANRLCGKIADHTSSDYPQFQPQQQPQQQFQPQLSRPGVPGVYPQNPTVCPPSQNYPINYPPQSRVDLTDRPGLFPDIPKIQRPMMTIKESTDDYLQFSRLSSQVGSGYQQDLFTTDDSSSGALARINHHFNWKLLQNIHRTIRKQGGLYSPFSISYALNMLFLATRGNSRSQLHQALGVGNVPPEMISTGLRHLYLESIHDINLPMKVANAFFYDFKIQVKPKYLQFMQGLGKVEKCNFRSNPEGERCRINRWVSQVTQRLIPELLGPGVVNRDTRMALINAIYFKADWKHQFDKTQTQQRVFYGSHTPQVDLMHLNYTKLDYTDDPLHQILEMPYKNERFVFGLVLPKDRNMTMPQPPSPSSLSKWWQEFRRPKVEVYLPKFRQESEFELVPLMQKLGVNDIFSYQTANFGPLTDSKELEVSHIIHKAVMIVDEEGVEASAATAVMISRNYSAGGQQDFEEKITVRADHPFHYYIRDKKRNNLLFMGFYT